MSFPAPILLSLRFTRIVVVGYGSVVEIRIDALQAAVLKNVLIELRSDALESGAAECRLDEFATPSITLPLRLFAMKAGVFPLEVRVTAGTERGQLTAIGHHRANLTVLEKPESLQNFSVNIHEKAFQGAIFSEVAEAIKIGQIRDVNHLFTHVFDQAPQEPVSLAWIGFPVVRSLKPGFVFAQRFELIRLLGAGGMGAVWLAADSALRGRHVALKFLPEEVCHDPGAVDDLRDEVLKARDLSHENIVRIYDLIEADGTAAISMEYIDGPTLDSYRRTLPNKVFEADDIHRILPALCGALDYAHQRGLIHHDIKPLNLMLTATGVLKVCDFGLAGSLCETKSKLSCRKHSTSGTTPYMSPQHLLTGSRTVGDDVYSLGATLYELMTGKPPFFRGDLRHQIENEQIPTIADRRAVLGVNGRTIPEVLERKILACLSKLNANRPATCGDLCRISPSNPNTPPRPKPSHDGNALPGNRATTERDNTAPHRAPAFVTGPLGKRWLVNPLPVGVVLVASIASSVATSVDLEFPTELIIQRWIPGMFFGACFWLADEIHWRTSPFSSFHSFIRLLAVLCVSRCAYWWAVVTARLLTDSDDKSQFFYPQLAAGGAVGSMFLIIGLRTALKWAPLSYGHSTLLIGISSVLGLCPQIFTADPRGHLVKWLCLYSCWQPVMLVALLFWLQPIRPADVAPAEQFGFKARAVFCWLLTIAMVAIPLMAAWNQMKT